MDEMRIVSKFTRGIISKAIKNTKMLDPNVIKSRAAVAAYKELNKNTVEKLVKGAGNSKTWYFEKVQIDENAAKFQSDQKKAIAEAEKLKKAAKRSKTPSKAKKEKERQDEESKRL